MDCKVNYAEWYAEARGRYENLEFCRGLMNERESARRHARGRSRNKIERSESEEVIRNNIRQAQQNGQPVILDFYADWCISCKVMEREVFSKPKRTE